ncbi:eukaryotic translation initiation factor 3 subunit 2 [Theileria orientalis strain Shintoku]|uniref:Eukaryotic translation initiation factor 3 subunit K n=1 Tax=Theileria orientalis strain Shintoku TaxID=869250 RepID=J4CCU8_THEOR|nr:eukaryotic translation initiation factor 3 subunit 2 [Theileria orientalis strain Shintoku]PVC51151.1 eukaryotic translation initiation factor 3 subunit 2 [Theileria orientalis]BAM40017.1 eukaryotic translation initiation factor 3 subunit 2 [Theileria orientalis strain Shintoku]|eukprot:XP_009690318.1 eukaryotic translation initiation factor 3 subunit 2 [Theileria orientalis strain Shintoku]
MDSDFSLESKNKSDFLLESPSSRFQLSSLPVFVESLDQQMLDNNLYSIKNNVAILKLYLIYPREANPLVIQKILIQSLTQFPSSDFTVCVAQIPLPLQAKEPVAKIIKLHSLLHNCMFLAFWEAAKSPLECSPDKTILDVPGVCDTVRRFVLDMLPMVYHYMKVPEVRRLLNFSSNSQEFEDTLSLCGWAFDSSYDRADEESGSCYSIAKEESTKMKEGASKLSLMEKYLRIEPMTHYYNTLH